MIVRPLIVAALVAEAVALSAALALVTDFRAHRASEQLAGVNIWGYRGSVLPEKGANEIRIAVVGGNLAFGWGVAAGETVAPNLRLQTAIVVDRPGRQARRVTAVNLGALGLPSSGYATRLEHYRYLQPDVVCIYVDPPGQASGRAVLPPEESAVFAATGYAPMLPLVLVDKGKFMRSVMVERAGRLLQRLDSVMYRVWFAGRTAGRASDADPIEQAVRAALGVAPGVVIVAPPRSGGEGDVSPDMTPVATVASRFHDEPRVRFVDLGDVPELAAADLRLDGVNFSTAGHAKVAEHVAPAVLDLIEAH